MPRGRTSPADSATPSPNLLDTLIAGPLLAANFLPSVWLPAPSACGRADRGRPAPGGGTAGSWRGRVLPSSRLERERSSRLEDRASGGMLFRTEPAATIPPASHRHRPDQSTRPTHRYNSAARSQSRTPISRLDPTHSQLAGRPPSPVVDVQTDVHLVLARTVGQSVATWLGVLHSLAHSSPTMMLCKPSSRYTVPPEIRPDDHQIDHASLAERAPVGTLPEAMDRRIPMSGPPPAWDGSARPADVVVGRGRR